MSETSQLIILGNGFDLHCGLNSSYEEFFRAEILDTIAGSFGVTKMQANCVGFWEELLLYYYHNYGVYEYNWCDIEEIIKTTLWSICFGTYNSKKVNKSAGIWQSALSNVKNRIDIYDKRTSISEGIEGALEKYFTQIFYRWGVKPTDKAYLTELLQCLLKALHNFERRFCKYIRNLLVNSSDSTQVNKNYIINAIKLLCKLMNISKLDYNELNDIIDISAEYLTVQMPKPDIGYIPNEKNRLKEEIAEISDVSILSFNYTALFDVLKVDSPCKYSNVHGKICLNSCSGKCKDSNIIFGIDDIVAQSQNEVPELRMFSKTYRKMCNGNSPMSILPPKDEKNVHIKFYGHSLSEADYSYFQSIFDYYNIYDNSKVSLMFYYSKGFEQTDKIYDLINSYGNTLENKDQGKNLIHKLLLENRLQVIEIE